jgi:hypothetical protein
MQRTRRRGRGRDEAPAHAPEDPSGPRVSAAATQILRLQQTAGNQAVASLLGRAPRLQRLIALEDQNEDTP